MEVNTSGSIIVLIIAFALVLAFWVVMCVINMKFCTACGHPHPAFVWIPLPCVPVATVMQSMNLMGAVPIPYNVLGILGWVLSLVPFLAWIPILGWILAALCGITSFVLGLMFLFGLVRTASSVGRNGVLMLLLYMFVPVIGQPLAIVLITNSINTYAEMAYSE